jgi:hypothetical protein
VAGARSFLWTEPLPLHLNSNRIAVDLELWALDEAERLLPRV